MKLYLYTSAETALNIIKTSTLALSSPKSFNDPFDCLPLWSDEDLHKAIDVFNGYIIEQTLFDLIEQKAKSIHSISQKLIMSIVLAEYKLLKKLARKKPGAYDPYYKTDRVKKCILDSDMYNEVDDQYAFAYCLASDKVDLLSVNAAPFHNEKSSSFEDGMYKSFDETMHILSLCDMKLPVYKGATKRISDNANFAPVDSEGARNIIKTNSVTELD